MEIMSKRLLALSLLLITSAAYSQTEQKNRSSETIKLSTQLVVLDAQIVNKKTGRVVSGLAKEDFELYEDGVRQAITHFSQDKTPLSVVLLLDVSASTIKRQIKDGGLRALERLKRDDEVAFMPFSDYALVVQGFTKDKPLCAERIAKWFANDIGEIVVPEDLKKLPRDGTHIADSIYQASEYLLKAANPDGRRVIIAVTDNWPWESWTLHSKKEVTYQLFEAGSVVYGLITRSYSSGWVYRALGYNPLVPLANKLRNKGGKVDLYADVTGGAVLDGRNRKAEERLADLIGLLRSRYTFGYVSSNQNRDGTFRKIQLKVSPEVEKREGKIAILTRKGYYAQN
jgi:Ca-activated chloride channel homolog